MALLAGLLSAVAVAMVARDFAQNRLDDCALMRVLGVPQSLMARIYTVEFLLVGCWPAQWAWFWGGSAIRFCGPAGQSRVGSLPGPTWRPFAVGTGVGILLTLVLVCPRCCNWLRCRLCASFVATWWLEALSVLAWLSGLVSLTGLLLLVARDWKLGGIALGGLLALCWCLPC